jgi:hypothetical protein
MQRNKSQPTFDGKRRRVPQEDDRPPLDRFVDRFVWPRIHGKWWTFDVQANRMQQTDEVYETLRADEVEAAKETLDHVEEIAQGAVERAAAADRRATTIAGTVAIAASFTLTGGSLALDGNKWGDADARRWFAIGLCVTSGAFVLSAFYALRALVATRVWHWSQPFDLPIDLSEQMPKRLGMRATHLLQGFAGNWEISDLKNRLVDLALRWLLLALAAIVALAVIVAIEVG